MGDIPFDAEMEAAMIGAMLLTAQARRIGLDMLGPSDFHDPKCAAMFSALDRLVASGSAIDAKLVADEAGIDATYAFSVLAMTPASQNAQAYADRLATLGGFRRTLALADALRDAAFDRDGDAIDRMLIEPMARILPHYERIDPPIDAAALAGEDYAPEFVLPRLLARQEVAMWVGEPGYGKSTLLRQIATMGACGMSPFTGNPIEPVRVLMVDCQESRGQAGAEIAKLLAVAGERYKGGLWIEAVPQGIDLSARRWQRWLDAKVASVAADLVILGPLYNMVRGEGGRSKQSEETAELAMNALGDLMVARNVALMIEAHAPHGGEMRVRGSKLWEDWPDFGFGLVPDDDDGRRAVDVKRFRGDRHAYRRWPKRYEQGDDGDWPWKGKWA